MHIDDSFFITLKLTSVIMVYKIHMHLGIFLFKVQTLIN